MLHIGHFGFDVVLLDLDLSRSTGNETQFFLFLYHIIYLDLNLDTYLLNSNVGLNSLPT